MRKYILLAKLKNESNVDDEMQHLRIHYPAPARTVETEKVLQLSNTNEKGNQNGLVQVILDDDGVDIISEYPPGGVVDLSIWTDGMGPHCLCFATLHSHRFFNEGKSNAHFVAGYLGGEKVMKANSGTLWGQIGPMHESSFTNPFGNFLPFNVLISGCFFSQFLARSLCARSFALVFLSCNVAAVFGCDSFTTTTDKEDRLTIRLRYLLHDHAMMGKDYMLKQGTFPMRSPFGRHNMNFGDTVFYQAPCMFEVSHLLALHYWASQEMDLFTAVAVSAEFERVTTANLATRTKLLAFSGGGIPQAVPLMYNWIPEGDMRDVLATPCPMHNVTAAQKFLLRETLEQCVPPGSKKERGLYFGYLENMVGSTSNHTIVESCSRYKKWIAEAHGIFSSTIEKNHDPKQRVFRFNFALGSLLGSHLSATKTTELTNQELFKHFALSMVTCVLIGKMSTASGGIVSVRKQASFVLLVWFPS